MVSENYIEMLNMAKKENYCKICRFCSPSGVCLAGGKYSDSYQSCFMPKEEDVQPCIRKLLDVKCNAKSSTDRICAAMLLDIYMGISHEQLVLKYKDCYGHVGHTNTGMAYQIEYMLSKQEYTPALGKMLLFYEAAKAESKVRNQKNMVFTRYKSNIDARLLAKGINFVKLDGEYFIVVKEDESGKVITPQDPFEAVSCKTLSAFSNGVSEVLADYMEQRPELKEKAKRFSVPSATEAAKYAGTLSNWDKPYWTSTPMKDSKYFLLAVMPDQSIIPTACFNGNIYIRPFITIAG